MYLVSRWIPFAYGFMPTMSHENAPYCTTPGQTNDGSSSISPEEKTGRRMPTRRMAMMFVATLTFLGSAVTNAANIDPAFQSQYSLANIGAPAGVPGYLGGLTLKAGDPNTLLIGGNANTASGGIYQIGLQRDANNNIIGFSGTATKYMDAPYIDGGLSYGPGGNLFYTSYYSHQTAFNNIGQIKPGSTAADRIINLSALGVSSSVGGLAFAPDGSMKILQYNSPGNIYTSTLEPDGNGTYDITGVTLVATQNGNEGLAYVPNGSALFPNPSALIADYATYNVWAMDIDANYNPIPSTKRKFVTNLGGAEGAFFDPYSNNFLFSQYGSTGEVIVVNGFAAPVPEPSTYALGLIATGVLARVASRRKQKATA